MKRVIKFVKQNIIGFVLGIIVTGIGVVTATNLVPATGVTYSNSNFNVTNVNEALDELFEAADNADQSSNIISIPVPTSETTIDIKEYTTNWSNLTDDNFIITSQAYAHGSTPPEFAYDTITITNPQGTYTVRNASTNTISVSHSYDAGTGILTLTIPTGTGTINGANYWSFIRLYCYVKVTGIYLIS